MAAAKEKGAILMQEFMTIILLCSLRIIVMLLLLSVLFKLSGTRLTASIRYTIWRIFAIIAVIPINYHTPLINVNHSTEQPAVSYAGELQEVTASGNYSDSIDFWKMLFVFWIMGTLFFGAYQIMKNLAVISRVERWRFSDKEAETIFNQVKRELNIRKNVKFYRSKAAVSPLTFGFIHQTVVIPFDSYSSDELRLIFKHELTHVSRRDSVFKWITLILVATHWFNPFIYLFLYRFNAECELSCDERVTKSFCYEECFAYGELILKSASRQKHYLQLYPTMAVRNSSLKTRLQQIINKEKHNQNPFIGAAALSISIATVLLMPCVIGYGDIPTEEKTHQLASAVQMEPQSTASTTLSENGDSFETTSTTENMVFYSEKTSTDTTTAMLNQKTSVNAAYSSNETTIGTSTVTHPTESKSAAIPTTVTNTTITATITTATVYRHH